MNEKYWRYIDGHLNRLANSFDSSFDAVLLAREFETRKIDNYLVSSARNLGTALSAVLPPSGLSRIPVF